jgi:hypothetical protein
MLRLWLLGWRKKTGFHPAVDGNGLAKDRFDSFDSAALQKLENGQDNHQTSPLGVCPVTVAPCIRN